MTHEHIDIAIVGGGISGVYSAWRLKQANPGHKIVVFEGSDHIGGRLLSVRPPGITNMVAELGGMRILPAVQPLITQLIDTLNQQLPPNQQIERYNFPVDSPQNIAYLRGVHLRLSDFNQRPDKVPYHLSFLERGSTVGRIIVNAIEQIVPGITSVDLNEDARRKMAQEATFDGQPLYTRGFWDVLTRVMSNEAYQLGVDAGGYQTLLSNWNAAAAIPWYLSDFGVDPVYQGFKNGFQQVPLTLAGLFKGDGGDIQLNTQVKGFNATDGGFELQIQDTTSKTSKTIRATSLILAMPRRSLELLAPESPLLHDIHDSLIATVTPRPLFKLFTTYANPWWRAAGYTEPDQSFVAVQEGRTVTDLPVRQTYYWPKDDGKPATSGPSMLMASYDDGTNIGFWDGFRPRRRKAWQEGREVATPGKPFRSDRDQSSQNTWDRYKPEDGMVAEVARQLALIHGLSDTPTVRHAAFRDWGDDPFGGGWNSWNIGVKSWEVKEQIVRPFGEKHALFICGEAYSDAQGWVEGALQTADRMLRHFNLGSL